MTVPVQVRGLTVRYGGATALDDVTFDIAPGTLCGLLGRNGAGKTTLLRTLAAYQRPTQGSVLIDGEDPWEHERLMSEVCLVRDGSTLEESSRVAEEIELCQLLRPRWDDDLALRLLDTFGIDPGRKIGALSRGQRSAVAIALGMATRAPLTMYDEPHLGLDAPTRVAFYDELLADYVAHPRTVIVSTHLIDEIAPLLEDVVVLHEGRVRLHAPAEDLRTRGAEVTGPADRVDEFAADFTVLSERSLGPTKAVVLDAELDAAARSAAADAGLEIGPIPLQDLFIGLTTTQEHAS